jgi:hypothetical protein
VALYIGAAVGTIINDCPNTLLAPDVYVRLPFTCPVAVLCLYVALKHVKCLRGGCIISGVVTGLGQDSLGPRPEYGSVETQGFFATL